MLYSFTFPGNDAHLWVHGSIYIVTTSDYYLPYAAEVAVLGSYLPYLFNETPVKFFVKQSHNANRKTDYKRR